MRVSRYGARMINRLSLLVAFVAPLAVTGCMPKKSGDSTTSTTTGEAAAPAPTSAFGGTMADAPVHHQGGTLEGPAGCRETFYAKFDFPVGQPVKMDVAVKGPAGACISISYLKANGGAVDGMMKEMCIDKNPTETWDVQGLEGGSFVQVTEQPPCKGATISIASH